MNQLVTCNKRRTTLSENDIVTCGCLSKPSALRQVVKQFWYSGAVLLVKTSDNIGDGYLQGKP